MYWASGTEASNIMRQNFWDGKVVAIVHTSSLYNTHVDNCNFDVGMAWMPGQLTNFTEIGGSALMLPAKADQRQKNAGWKLMEYMLETEVNMTWAQLARIWMAYMAETIDENRNVPDQMRRMAAEINDALRDY